MKKLLLATLTTLSIITVPALAGERPDQGDDYRVEIHLECIMHPVLTETDIKQNPYTKQEYEIMTYKSNQYQLAHIMLHYFKGD